jgi:hypothetical protein
MLKFNEKASTGAELFHAHGQADVTKIIVAFRSFGNALTNEAAATEPSLVFLLFNGNN